MFMSLRVVITGAGRGMARDLAAAFAAEGARVSVSDRDAAAAARTAGEIGGIGFGCDVREEAAVAAMIAGTVGALGGIDVLVNAAGGYGAAFRATHDTPADEWDMVLDSNLKGSFLTAKHALPHLIAAGGGVIVNISSNAGRTVSPLLGASYTAAKAGVIGLTRHLSREYARHNVRVNTVAPGPMAGERLNDLLDADGLRALEGQIPLGRLAVPADIVGAILFLCAPQARFITGAILDVNGGYVLAP
jgi:3-oxoacyl-[acyl-carrier protein] reductase